MNRKQKIIVSITGIFIVLLALVGLTYAYFLTRITGNENDESIKITTANLELVYGGDDGSIIGDNEIIEPGKKFNTKTFTVTNRGNGVVDRYAVILEDVSTTYASTFRDDDNNEILAGTPTAFKNPEDFKITITCSSLKAGASEATECGGMSGTLPLMESETLDETYITNGILLTNSIEIGEVQTYSVELEYTETNTDQSDDMNKNLKGKLNIIDTKNTVDIAGIVRDSALGDKVIINSTRRESQINSDGSYKIIGLDVGVHSIKLNDREIEKISIEKGKETSVGTTIINGEQVKKLTITDDSRLAKIDIYVNENKIEIDNEIEERNPFKSGTLAYSIYENGAQVLNATTNELEIDKTYNEKTQITKISDGTDMTDVGIFTAPDDYGTSYYFRGPVKNNYVDFAGFTWRIVRINGDGTIRLILDGTLDKTCVEYDTDNTCKTYAGTTSTFNSSANDNAYVGYMYGFTGGVTNKCLTKDGTKEYTVDSSTTYTTKETCESAGGRWAATPYETTHINKNSSTIKTNVDTFYERYIENNANNIHYEQYLADTMFCGDKSLAASGIGGVTTQLGYGTGSSNKTYYAATERLEYSSGTTSITTANPTLKCAEGQTNTYSRYTKEEQNRNNVLTNGDLKHPIALLSADELVLAGAFISETNKGYYLYDSYANGTSNNYWWSLSPYVFYGSTAGEFISHATSNSLDGSNVHYFSTHGSRPVINLRSNVLIESGDGTSGNGAYKVRLAS